MFCVRCGRHIAGNINFCPYCGAESYREETAEAAPAVPVTEIEAQTPVQAEVLQEKPEQTDAQTQVAQEKKQTVRAGLGLAITLTAISLVMWNVLSMITGTIAIVFAALAKGKCKAGNLFSAKAKARTAKAMNITTIALLVLWIVMIVALVLFAVDATQYVMELSQSGALVDTTAEELGEFLQSYGYYYDTEVLEEYLEYSFGAGQW